MADDPAYTILLPAEVAEMLRTSERHLKRLASGGLLRPVRIGGVNRYRLADIHHYLDSLAPMDIPPPEES